MKKTLAAFILIFSIFASAQATNPAAKSATTGTTSTTGTSAAQSAQPTQTKVTAPAQTATTAGLPTRETVESFLKRMFEAQPGATWSVQSINPVASAPGVADVAVIFGNNTQATHLLVLPGGHWAVDQSQLMPFGADPFAADRKTLESSAHGPHKGAAKPDVTVVVFSDLECPHCKATEPLLDRLIEDMPNVQLVFQPFPLVSIHRWAFKAAQYAECVRKQNEPAFFTFAASVFDAQSSIKDDDPDPEKKFNELAAAAGVDNAKVTACAVASASYLEVQNSVKLGMSLGVNSTPTVYVNGRKLLNVAEMPYEQFKTVVKAEADHVKK